MSEWIKSKDRLPESGQAVLMLVKSTYNNEPDMEDQWTMQTGYYGWVEWDHDFKQKTCHDEWCYISHGGFGEIEPINNYFDSVPYWMPLPEPPAKD